MSIRAEDEPAKIFFAHSEGTYGTPEEARALAILKREFPEPDHVIINPADPEHRGHPDMERYTRSLIKDADAFSYLPFPDGKIGHDIELQHMHFCDCNPHGGFTEIDLKQDEVLAPPGGDLDGLRVLSQIETDRRNQSATQRSK